MSEAGLAAIVAIGRAIVWLAIALVARNALQIWIRFKEDQAAIARAQGRALDESVLTDLGALGKLGKAPSVPRDTYNGANGNRDRLAALSRPGDVVVPDDLEAHCAQWDDAWARDDERANVRAKFVELYNGDATATWQLVRRAVGIGEMP